MYKVTAADFCLVLCERPDDGLEKVWITCWCSGAFVERSQQFHMLSIGETPLIGGAELADSRDPWVWCFIVSCMVIVSWVKMTIPATSKCLCQCIWISKGVRLFLHSALFTSVVFIFLIETVALWKYLKMKCIYFNEKMALVIQSIETKYSAL